MADLAIITPTRGRPQRLAEMLAAVKRTTELDVSVYIGLDLDDDSDYLAALGLQARDTSKYEIHAVRGKRRSLSGWTNYLADYALGPTSLPIPRPRYLASLGDDHIPRTKGWDRILVEAIENNMIGPGFAYGNDLLQGGALPTAWVASAEAVRALGWMMLPTCSHMYVDTAIRELGTAASRLWYEPTVIIEHAHPIAGKVEWDESYRESNSTNRYAEDEQAYQAWRNDGGLARDTATLSALTY